MRHLNNHLKMQASMNDLIEVLFPVALFNPVLEHTEPFKRGFFCNDQSLMYPHRPSTISGAILMWIGISLPISIIIVTEFVISRLRKTDNCGMEIFNRIPISLAKNVYNHVIVFLYGMGLTLFAMYFGKIILGRFRPHFLTVCQPIMSDGTNCSDPINWHRYIEDFTCGNTETTKEILREARLSFPSGHASYGFYTMTYAAFYLHYKMTWNGSRLLKSLLQFVLITMASGAALSRIPDYMHHCK